MLPSGLKAMIKEVDEDDDGAICFREFLLIFRKAAAGELDLQSGLGQLASLTEVDVDEVGVGGAKNFFEAKVRGVGELVSGPFNPLNTFFADSFVHIFCQLISGIILDQRGQQGQQVRGRDQRGAGGEEEGGGGEEISTAAVPRESCSVWRRLLTGHLTFSFKIQ